jgi:hypothetical protein
VTTGTSLLRDRGDSLSAVEANSLGLDPERFTVYSRFLKDAIQEAKWTEYQVPEVSDHEVTPVVSVVKVQDDWEEASRKNSALA